jgi:hypothetical protein
MANVRTRRTVGRLLALVACASLAGAPFACGSAFTTSGGDAMAPDGSTGGDGTVTEGSIGDASGSDGSTTEGGDAAGATVQGTVVDAYLLPMSGIDVHCQGQKATTAANGTFTLTGIAAPYNATVVAPQTVGPKHGYLFVGVSRLDPTLQLALEQSKPTETATLTGTMSTNAPNAAGIVFADFPAATPANASPTIPIAIGATTFSGDLSWTGHTSATPTVYILQWLTTGNLPSAYIAFESTSETLTSGTSTTWSPPLTPTVGSGSMTVTLMPSAGYVPIDIGVYVRPPGAGVAAPIQHGVKAGEVSSTVITPDITNATFAACGLQVLDTFDGGPTQPYAYTCTTGLGKSDSPTLQPPPATTFVSAPSTAGLGTVFDYTGIPGGVYLVAFGPTASAASTSDALFVITNGTQAAIPDLSALSFAFHPGDAFTAEVFGLAPFSGIDSALGPTGFEERLNAFRVDVGPTSTGSVSYGGASPFTAK